MGDRGEKREQGAWLETIFHLNLRQLEQSVVLLKKIAIIYS